MQTPYAYKKSLKNGIVTWDMFVDCVLSANERAHNYEARLRDNAADIAWVAKRKRRYPTRKYPTITDSRDYLARKRAECYRTKAQLLSHVTPTCIHETVIQQWHRVNSTDFPTMEQYQQQYESDLKAGLVRRTNMRRDPKSGVETPFYDVDGTFSSFYLYYELKKEQTFHTPIDADDVERYRKKYGIGIVRIEGKIFKRKHPYLMDDLVSVQFVQRVITALDNGTAKIVRDNCTRRRH